MLRDRRLHEPAMPVCRWLKVPLTPPRCEVPIRGGLCRLVTGHPGEHRRPREPAERIRQWFRSHEISGEAWADDLAAVALGDQDAAIKAAFVAGWDAQRDESRDGPTSTNPLALAWESYRRRAMIAGPA